MYVFTWKPSDMTGVHKRIIKHTLNLNISVPPVAQKQRVLGIKRSRAVMKEVEEWVKADIDYYPLPEIDLKIKLVMGFRFKCFLDAYKWYHQIQMSEEVKEKTTFYTDQGTHCYTKTPFRLKNAGATYQILVDSAFQAELGRNLEAYVDDMVINSKTEPEMIIDIEETFDNLWKINMKLNLKKCSFGVEEGKFLGYMLTPEGIRENPKKTKAVTDMQSPKTLKVMQTLSGKLTALNRFLARSAERSLPFFETLKNINKENKDNYWWTEDVERAFQEMKKLIIELLTLSTPMPKETLYIYRATSQDAISGVLLVERKGKQTPIRYIIQTLYEAERNYAPLEKLALCHYICPEVELGAYDIMYIPRNVIKGQVLADFLNETHISTKHMEICSLASEEANLEEWTLYTDGASSLKGVGAGLVLIDPAGVEYTYAIRLNFLSTNNEAGKLASVAFNHLTKEILVEVVNVKSVDAQKISTIIEEEGDNWMTPIIRYLEEWIWREDEKEARNLQMKRIQYVIEEGVLFKKSYLAPMLRCVGLLHANYVIKEVHEGAFRMHSGLRSMVAKIMRQGFGLPRVMVTDNETQLVNDPFKNKSLMHGIKARLGRERTGWVDELPNVLWAHRTMLKTNNGETSFSLTYKREAVIRAEIGMPTFRTIFFNKARNEEEMRLNFNLIQERREITAIREAK
ncbi:reverse transcriptase domain-containing protein [Tanacetum coccineum]